MKIETLNKAIFEAKRFLNRAKEYNDLYEKEKSKAIDQEHKYFELYQTKESAAVKRASMDLTRALSELRKS